MRGQINLEYLGAATLFLAALSGLFLFGDSIMPHLESVENEGGKYMEARQVSDSLVNMEGETDWWEASNANPSHIGLSNGSKYHLDREKINALGNDFSYGDFLNSTDIDRQFQLIFEWLPTTTLPVDFRKERPEEAGINDMPNLEGSETDPRYGNITLDSTTYHLITVFSPPDFQKKPLFISENRDSGYQRYNTTDGDSDTHIEVDGEPLKVEEVYQGENSRSSMAVFRQDMKAFGPETDSNADSVRMERVAVLEGHPIRIGVVAW